MRRLDVKARLSAVLVRDRFGAQPVRVVRLLAVVDSTTNRSRVTRLDALFGPAFPLRGVALRRWLETPAQLAAATAPGAGGLLFVRNVPGISRGVAGGGPHRMRRPRGTPPGQSRVDSRTASPGGTKRPLVADA